jgi:hypothetical protein
MGISTATHATRYAGSAGAGVLYSCPIVPGIVFFYVVVYFSKMKALIISHRLRIYLYQDDIIGIAKLLILLAAYALFAWAIAP